MLAGPALGGALVAVLGPAPAFAIDAATFVISAATLAGVRSAARKPPATAEPAAAAEPARDGAVPGKGTRPPTAWRLLRSERVLQIVLLVTVAANLGGAGADEVALPAFVRGPLHAGAGSYGSLIAAFGAGALLGTLTAGQVRRARRPAVLGSIAFLAEAFFLAIVPFAGGVITIGAACAAFGLCNGFGNVVMITVFQRWAPPELLGRLTGLLMLASFGVFPISVALGAVVVHNFGPAVFFPLAAAFLAAAILAGLSQRSWRELGAEQPRSAARRPRSRSAGRPSPVPASTDIAECAS
jgi:predicted MFS family arabinose efflux permease